MSQKSPISVKIFILVFIILLNIGIVFSHTEEDFEEAKQLIDSKTSCSELTEDQLEHIGDYLMEQMHPGEAHEAMDEMMGGEGSESLRQMHIAMAKRLYCNDVSGMTSYGMMGMMGSGMMNMMMGGFGKGINYGGGMMGYGMMGNYGYGYWNFINVLYIILLIGLIILVYLWVIKLWKNIPKKK